MRALIKTTCWLPVLAALLAVSCSAATPDWGLKPYRVRVWVATDDFPAFSEAWLRRVVHALKRRSEAQFDLVWNMETEFAPAVIRSQLRRSLDLLDVQQLIAADDALFECDKLYLVVVRTDRLGFETRVRELDCNAFVLGHVQAEQVSSAHLVAESIARQTIRAFRPICQIQRVRDKEASLLPRAGFLIDELTELDSESGSSEFEAEWTLPEGSLLRPIVRRNDRYGRPRSGGIQPLAWTIFEVSTVEHASRQCKVHSGIAQPIRSRRTPRVQQFAIQIRTQPQPTSVHLRSLSADARPLPGYGIFSRDEKSKLWNLVTHSDWRGVAHIPSGPVRMQTFYVKNGNQLLARLPMVPGEFTEMEARLPDDEERLEVEGYLTGMQERLIDLVTRRSILAARIRSRLEQGRKDEAQELFQELNSLDTKDTLIRELRERRQRIQTTNRRTRQKIDKLFADLRQRIDRFLDSNLISEVRDELEGTSSTENQAGAVQSDDSLES